jgi:pimeloyl-ACP methyl ester carboxylesterase
MSDMYTTTLKNILVTGTRVLALAVATVSTGCTTQPPPPEPASAAAAAVVQVRRDYATVNGLRMYYEIHGSGRPLVLLHGAFGVAETWAPMLPALTKNKQVIIVEQQGHGRTVDRSGPLTYEQMADDTSALLRELKIGPVDVFGYSDGGIVALGVAFRAPDLVRRIAIFGANAGSVKETHEPEMYEAFANLPADFAPAEFKDPYDRVAPDKTKWPELVRKIKEMGLGFRGYSDADVRSIKALTLIMQGDRDIVRPEHAVRMFRMIPQSQLAILASGDHFMPIRSPDRVVATLLQFLDAPEASPGR